MRQPLLVLALLALAALACQAESLRARDLPVWECPTPSPAPTHTMAPLPTVGAGTATAAPAATFTPWPTVTPFLRSSEFRLERRVRIGGLGGLGLGIRVWMQDLETSGPDTQGRWIARWQVGVENGSLSQPYEFYPFLQSYVLEVADPAGQPLRGAWGPSGAALAALDLPEPRFEEESTLVEPGGSRLLQLAAYIPGPEALRLAYVLDPLDASDPAGMAEANALGGNIAVWVSETEGECGYPDGELPGAVSTSPAYSFLLARHPVEGTVQILRGFGCSDFFTGELGTACPASAPWFHNGLDYLLPAGAPYLDPLPVEGQLLYAGEDLQGPDCSGMAGSQAPHRGYGRYVKHTATVDGHRVEVWGAHLSALNVSSGQDSQPALILGLVGSSGCSTGSHLHFSVRVDGRYLDPLSLIP